MILAGIDEAGYGPVLGPLVVGCCAFEVEGDPAADPPCLWKVLRKHVSRNRLRGGKKLHVNDSKLVYSSAGGLKELERSILAMAAAWQGWPEDLHTFLCRVAGDVVAEMAGYSWYRPAGGEAFPLEQDGTSVRLFANALRLEMDRVNTRCVHMAARVICERELNRMFTATRNKGNTLFSIAAVHLDCLLRNFGDRGLVIICDRQGGRGHYGSLLRLMFDEWTLEIVSEREERSDYLLRKGGNDVRIVFCEKAETACMPVALASMLSKYLREAFMHRFNAFWQIHLPGVTPTAGYHTDGMRFLGDIEQKRREMGIGDEELIRSR